MSDPRLLDYARVEHRPLDAPTHIAMTIWATLCVGLLAIVLAIVVPRFEVIFRDFKTELPGTTKLVLSLSRWITNEYGWIFLPFLIVVVVVPGILVDRSSQTPLRTRMYRRVMTRLLLFAVVLIMAIIVLACAMPMISLINSVSSSTRK